MSAPVLVALSGGVDSSVAAALLVEEGHDVVGVTMRLWGGESDTGCCSVADVEDARRSAAQLGVDHHVFNFADEFERHVVQPYVADHAAGLTPNPCVECNRHLKFDVLLRRADLLGFEVVATGHHARIVRTATGDLRLARGRDGRKDQSYVLHPLLGEDLSRLRFPVGELTKDRVRDLASRRGLRTADKPESQDVCFITRAQGRRTFLEQRVELHPGRIVDTAGADVGAVDAVELVTIGQRRGLELAGGAGRRFVTGVDVDGRVVTVGGAEELLVERIDVGDLHLAPGGDGPPGPVSVQTSAHGEVVPATLAIHDDHGATVHLERPARRVAPGQSVVAYRSEELDDGTTAEVVVAAGVAVAPGPGDARAGAQTG